MESPDFLIKCVFDPEDGSFGGLLFGPQGLKLGGVTGTLSPDFFAEEPPRRSGRRRDYCKNVAVMGHVVMAQQANNSKLWEAQLCSANALCIGSHTNPDDQKRAIQRHITKAKEALSKQGMMLFHWGHPSDDVSTAIWTFFEIGAHIEIADKLPNGTATVGIKGKGWLCRWGDKKAKFGTISVRMEGRTDDAIRQMTEILNP